MPSLNAASPLANEALDLAGFRGQTLVLGFALSWQEACPRTLQRLRAELRGLGASLFLLSPEEVHVFRPDDDLQARVGLGKPDAVEPLMRLHGVSVESLHGGAITLVIVDGGGSTRWSQTVSSVEHPLGTLLEAISAAALRIQARRSSALGISRRELVLASLVVTFGSMFAHGCNPPPRREARKKAAPAPAAHERDVVLRINGEARTVKLEPRVSLLDALRERVGLTGTKKGCDHGQCGACTVLIAGQRMNACLLLAVMVENVEVTTIEGLAQGETLHPMQTAFIVEDGLQCGYCTPGQIVSAVGLLKENRARTDAEIREQMSGNICRCGAYPNIVRAIQRVRSGAPT